MVSDTALETFPGVTWRPESYRIVQGGELHGGLRKTGMKPGLEILCPGGLQVQGQQTSGTSVPLVPYRHLPHVWACCETQNNN